MTEKEDKPEVMPSGVDGGLFWKDYKVGTEVYRVRQITVAESDQAWDATTDEKTNTANPRARSRFELCHAIVHPPTEPADIETWSRYKLYSLLNAFDEVNNLPPADSEGNGSSPVTSKVTSKPGTKSTAS